jgi:hypothetical protein
LIAQGAVRVDGAVIRDVNFQFHEKAHRRLEVGKNRIAQVTKSSKNTSRTIDNNRFISYNNLSLVMGDPPGL